MGSYHLPGLKPLSEPLHVHKLDDIPMNGVTTGTFLGFSCLIKIGLFRSFLLL